MIGLTALILALFAATDPDSPAPSTLQTPHIRGPDIGTPTISPPGLSLPNVGESHGDRVRPERQGPERRTELTHDHHYRLVWMFSLPLALLALAGLAALYPFAGLPRRGQRGFAGVVAASLVALSVAAFAAGIDPQPGLGAYEHEPAEVERSDSAIVKRIHVHHRHEPIYLIVPWLLLGLGSALLAVPGGRVAAASQAKSDSRPTGAATA